MGGRGTIFDIKTVLRRLFYLLYVPQIYWHDPSLR